MFLSDTLGNLYKWKFPDWAVIPASGYVTVWCDEDNGQSGYHASFKFLNNGESVYLYDSISGMLDSLTFGWSYSDLTVARCPNGTGGFSNNIVATFSAYNTCVVSVPETMQAGPVKVYPNPSNGNMVLEYSFESDAQVIITDMTGKTVLAGTLLNGGHQAAISLDGVGSGIYLMRVMQNGTQLDSRKLIVIK